MILEPLMATQRSREQETVELPPLSRVATVVPGSLNEELRTVDVIWTTGARVLRGHYDKYWEELSLEPKHVKLKRLNNGAPFLDGHSAYSASDVVGVVVPKSARIENGQGRATVRFAKAEDDPEADKIFRKVKDGILQNISVGYATYKMEKTEDSVDKIPVYRAVDWEPYELSVVPMGADDGAGFRSKNSNNESDRGHTPCVFVNRSAINQETKMDPKDTPNTPSVERTEESVAVDATRAATTARIEDAKARAEAQQRAADEAVTKERQRIAEITEISERSGLGPAWGAALIKGGVTVEAARTEAFKHLTKRDADEFNTDGTVRIEAGDDQRDKFVRGASAWMFERTGTRKLLERAKEKSPGLFKDVAFDGGEFRGLSPIELARECLERAGVKTRGMDRMQMIGLAFTQRSNYQTTSDFAVLMENVLGKVLLGAYVTLPTTWEQFCGTDQVPDFRVSNRYYTGAFPSLLAIPEHAEYKNAVIPDGAKRSVTTERKGQILGLSREAILNDDMGALTNIATEIGKASGRTIEEEVYAFLALNGGLGPTIDANPFFHASRANVGTGAALSAAAIDADAAVMSYQKDPSGRAFLNLQPSTLLLARPLRGLAQTINESQYDPDTVANKAQNKPNVVRGLFGNVIGSPYFASASTRRYLFADPMVTPAIVVAFLEGYGRGPVMETKDGWRIDGVEWKVTLYEKVQPGDPKGAITNAGA